MTPSADIRNYHSTQKFLALDAIRGIAAVVVLMYHYWLFFCFNTSFAPPFHEIVYKINRYGFFAVDLFFILSGFIFCSIYGEKVASQKVSLKEFSLLRFSRLYPLHWLTLLIVLVMQLFRSSHALSDYPVGYSHSLFSFLLNIPLVQNGWVTTAYSFNGPAWSISVEIMMYLLFFAVFLCGRDKKTIFFLCTFFACMGSIMFFYNWQNGLHFIKLQAARGLTGFFLGCVMAMVSGYFDKNKKYELAFTIFLALFAIAMMVLQNNLRNTQNDPLMDRYPMYVYAVFPALIYLSVKVKVLSQILSIRPLLHLGSMSYSIYLLHLPVIILIKTVDELMGLNLDYSSRLLYLAFIAFVVILSYFTFNYFEKPMQSYIRGKFKIGKQKGQDRAHA